MLLRHLSSLGAISQSFASPLKFRRHISSCCVTSQVYVSSLKSARVHCHSPSLAEPIVLRIVVRAFTPGHERDKQARAAYVFCGN